MVRNGSNVSVPKHSVRIELFSYVKGFVYPGIFYNHLVRE